VKPRFSNQTNHALTLVEVLVVVSVLAILVTILMLALNTAKRKAGRIGEASVLKTIYYNGFQVWAYDHRGKFPMELSVAEGGSKELAAKGDVVSTFQVMSNELSDPKLLICPADTEHLFAANFSTGFSAKNISYFIGVDVSTNSTSAFFFGDDNFAIAGVPVNSGLLNLASNSPITWTAARHHLAGNIILADGSVQQVTTNGLQLLLQQTGLATNRLAIP